MRVTNQTLMAFLVVTVLVSLVGTFFSIQKLDTIKRFPTSEIGAKATSDAGNISLYINKTAAIVFVNDSINWGAGSVNPSGTNCTLETNGTLGWVDPNGCVGFSNQTGLILQNTGSLVVNVTLSFDTNASIIYGTTVTPQLWYYAIDNATGSCVNGLMTGWANVSMLTNVTICGNFSYTQDMDTMRIDMRARLPLDVISGQKVINVTAFAEQSYIQ